MIQKVVMCILSMMLFSTATYAQSETKKVDWLKELTDRIELHGYGQAGYSWQDANGKQVNDFNLKRTLFWAKARITDRWSFLFMHDFSSDSIPTTASPMTMRLPCVWASSSTVSRWRIRFHPRCSNW